MRSLRNEESTAELDRIVDKVLAYRPKPIKKRARRVAINLKGSEIYNSPLFSFNFSRQRNSNHFSGQ